jgi:hypothetical protein
MPTNLILFSKFFITIVMFYVLGFMFCVILFARVHLGDMHLL